MRGEDEKRRGRTLRAFTVCPYFIISATPLSRVRPLAGAARVITGLELKVRRWLAVAEFTSPNGNDSVVQRRRQKSSVAQREKGERGRTKSK